MSEPQFVGLALRFNLLAANLIVLRQTRFTWIKLIFDYPYLRLSRKLVRERRTLCHRNVKVRKGAKLRHKIPLSGTRHKCGRRRTGRAQVS